MAFGLVSHDFFLGGFLVLVVQVLCKVGFGSICWFLAWFLILILVYLPGFGMVGFGLGFGTRYTNTKINLNKLCQAMNILN